MGYREFTYAAVLSLGLLFVHPHLCHCADTSQESPASETPQFESVSQVEKGTGLDSIGAVVIHPYRSANVGTEVPGVIGAFQFDEGDKVEQDQVAVEILSSRYETTTQESEERLRTLELVLKRAEEELAAKRAVFSKEATTHQEVLRAEAEVEVARSKISEARMRLKLDRMNLEACAVRAPFSGFLAVRYKQPYETIDRLEKLFLLVEAARVYAVANVPEHLLPRFGKSSSAVFLHSSGTKYKGVVDKVGALIDPKSGTAKVYILIDNSKGELRIGTTGRLEIPR